MKDEGRIRDGQGSVAPIVAEWIVVRIHRFDSVTSTNDVAKAMAEDGAPHGTVVTAIEQTMGRGRRGRTWVSPPGAGLYASFIIHPFDPTNSAGLSLRCAVSAARAIESFSSLIPHPSSLPTPYTLPPTPLLKWPNDLLLNGRKIGGILVEAASGYAVVGIGINILSSANPLISENPDQFTALDREMEIAGTETHERLLALLIEEFDRLVGGDLAIDAKLMEEWARRDALAGRRIACTIGSEEFEGECTGIDISGALRIRLDSGQVRTINAGEIAGLGMLSR